MNMTYPPQQPTSRRHIGLAMVVGLHILVGWGLASGLARQAIDFVKPPLKASIVQEMTPPPPPPPPPEVRKVERLPDASPTPPPPTYVPPPEVAVTAPPPAAPVLAVAPVAPPAEPYKIQPPPPPAPVQQAPHKQDITVACPRQVAPQAPAKAVEQGLSGLVRAQVRIVGGKVREVTVLSGPRIFHAAVREAMMQYECVANADEIVATQEFSFTVD